MKKIFILSLFLGICAASFTQEFAGSFLETNKDKQADFTVVNITSGMLKMVASESEAGLDQEVKTIIQNIKGIRIISAVNNSKVHYNSAKNSLTKQYEELVSVDNSAKNVRIFTKDAQNNIASEVIMLMLENNKLTLIDIAGKVNLNQLSKLSTIVPGM